MTDKNGRKKRLPNKLNLHFILWWDKLISDFTKISGIRSVFSAWNGYNLLQRKEFENEKTDPVHFYLRSWYGKCLCSSPSWLLSSWLLSRRLLLSCGVSSLPCTLLLRRLGVQQRSCHCRRDHIDRRRWGQYRQGSGWSTVCRACGNGCISAGGCFSASCCSSAASCRSSAASCCPSAASCCPSNSGGSPGRTRCRSCCPLLLPGSNGNLPLIMWDRKVWIFRCFFSGIRKRSLFFVKER